MAGAMDPRIVRLGIEVGGRVKWFEDLDMTISGQKFANPLMNTCEVKVSNLAKATRDYIVTETSPFNPNRTPKRLLVEAGRKSTGTVRLFVGDITVAAVSQPPDIVTTIKAQTGSFKRGDIVQRKGAETQSLSSIAKIVAADVGASLVFQATDKQIANYSFSGAAAKQVDALADVGGVDVFLDDDKLIVKNKGEPVKFSTRKLSMQSGMVGIPELTEFGVKVKFLLDTQTQLGGGLEISSLMNPSLNGQYVIYKLDFDISTRDVPFYYVAEARRLGFKSEQELDKEAAAKEKKKADA